MKKNEVKLTYALKIHLLEAIQRGTLDLSIFDKPTDGAATTEEITAEIIRLEKYGNPKLLARLMDEWADGKLTDEEYLQERVKNGI